MRDFELTFEVPTLTEAVEDAIAEALDAVIATHAYVTTVTVVVAASDCVEAAQEAIATLRQLGAPPARLVDDLVTRGQIAERAGVTRQAVGLWIRGERRTDLPFPKPFVLTGGGLWLWGEVAEVLTARGDIEAEGVEYPTRREAQMIGGLLAGSEELLVRWFAQVRMGATAFGVTPGAGSVVRPTPAPTSVQADFAPAA